MSLHHAQRSRSQSSAIVLLTLEAIIELGRHPDAAFVYNFKKKADCSHFIFHQSQLSKMLRKNTSSESIFHIKSGAMSSTLDVKLNRIDRIFHPHVRLCTLSPLPRLVEIK